SRASGADERARRVRRSPGRERGRRTVNVLALNCGSSSVKFRLFDVAGGHAAHDDGVRLLARGLVEQVGGTGELSFTQEGRPPLRESAAVGDHAAAVGRIVQWLGAGPARVDAVGHRVVHGGERFVEPVAIDADVDAGIEALEALAPLHNGPNLAGIRGCRAALGERIPMVAVFDTAFHAGLPEHVFRYAIPYELAAAHGIRRFGFHGISYQHVVARWAARTGRPEAEVTLVALHLGNGASAAAIRGGRSIDTSMGFTPLEGLVMGTRSGDLDPALVGFIAEREGVSADVVEQGRNERSGLVGLSGGNGDRRDLLAHRAGDERARRDVDVFGYRARKYLGAYLAALGGARAVVFTGGIGEHAAPVRAEICADMGWCGLALDPDRNARARGGESLISRADSAMAAWVIPTDEELVIAGETARAVAGARGA